MPITSEKYLIHLHFGRRYVAYQVLADLVLAGWLPDAEPGLGSKL